MSLISTMWSTTQTISKSNYLDVGVSVRYSNNTIEEPQYLSHTDVSCDCDNSASKPPSLEIGHV
ncbi:hypothetical protein Bca4012_049001 [Brassica carinata]|uniref:Uncharacterized protein n=1 Tax=Brassica oleracea var. oleracea TaxID=109376 RepID=A0A0D3AM97_BRAOL